MDSTISFKKVGLNEARNYEEGKYTSIIPFYVPQDKSFMVIWAETNYNSWDILDQSGKSITFRSKQFKSKKEHSINIEGIAPLKIKSQAYRTINDGFGIEEGLLEGQICYFVLNYNSKKNSSIAIFDVYAFDKENKAKDIINFNYYLASLSEQTEEYFGEIENKFENGQLKSTGGVLLGVKNGKWTHYHENGIKKKTVKCNNGIITEPYSIYHDNGALKVKYNFTNGILSGPIKFFHSNGKIQTIGQYINNNPVKQFKHYDDSGRLTEIENYNMKGEDDGVYKEFYSNGQVFKDYNYKDGERVGNYNRFYKSGKKMQTGNYIEGSADGIWISYYESGQIETKELYKGGKQIGDYIKYHKNGKIATKGQYNEDGRVGIWTTHYENGKTDEKGEYKSNRSIGIWVKYFENGNLKNKGLYDKGAHGEWLNNHPNGKLYQTRLWEHGKLMDMLNCFDGNGNTLDKGTLINGDGTVNYYNQDGKLEETVSYKNGYKVDAEDD